MDSQQTESSYCKIAGEVLIVLSSFLIYFQGVDSQNFPRSNWILSHQTCLLNTSSAIRSDLHSNIQGQYWTNYKLVIYSMSTWEDGSLPNVAIAQKNGPEAVECGVLHTNNGEPRLTLNSCMKKMAGHICQFNISDRMELLKNDMVCTPYNNMCYTYICGKSDWTRAQEDCISQGGTLADSLDEKAMQHISKKATKYHGRCRRFWINLNNFAFEDHDSGEKKVLVPWRSGHPKFNKRCVIRIYEGGILKYKSEDCYNSLYSFVCTKNQASIRTTAGDSITLLLYYQDTSFTTETPSSTASKIPLDANSCLCTYKLGFIISTTLLFLACALVLLVCLYRWHRGFHQNGHLVKAKDTLLQKFK